MPIPWWVLYSGSAATASGMALYEYGRNDNYFDRMKWAELTAGVSQGHRFYLSSGLKDYLYRDSEVYRIENALAREAWTGARPYVQQIDAAAAGIGDRVNQRLAKADQFLEEGRGRLDRAEAFVQGFAKDSRADLRQGLGDVGDRVKNLSDEVQKFAGNVERRVDQASEGWFGRNILGTKADLSSEEYKSLAAMNREAGGAENWYHKYDDGPNNPIEKAYSRLIDEGKVPQPKIPAPAAADDLQQRHPWLAEKRQAIADRPGNRHVFEETNAHGATVRTEIRTDGMERHVTRTEDGNVVFRSKETFDDGGRCVARHVEEFGEDFRGPTASTTTYRETAFTAGENGGFTRNYVVEKEERFLADDGGSLVRTIKDDIREVGGDGGTVAERSLFRHVETTETGILWDSKQPPQDFRLKETFNADGTINTRFLQDQHGVIGERVEYDAQGAFAGSTRELRPVGGDGPVQVVSRDLNGVNSYQVNGIERLKNPVLFEAPKDKHAHVEMLERRAKGEPAAGQGVAKAGEAAKAEAPGVGAGAGQALIGEEVAGRGGLAAEGGAQAVAEAEVAGEAVADIAQAQVGEEVAGRGGLAAEGGVEGLPKAGAAGDGLAGAQAQVGEGVAGRGGKAAQGGVEAAANVEAAGDGVVAAERARVADALKAAGIEEAEAQRLAAKAVDGARGGTIESRLDALFNEKGPLKTVDPHRYRDQANKPDQALYLLQLGENVVLGVLLFMGEGEPDTGAGLARGKEAFGAAREFLSSANPDPSQWVGPAMDSYATANTSLIEVAEKSAVDGSWLSGSSSMLTKLQGEVSDQASTVSWDRFFVGNWLIAMMILEPICRKVALVSRESSNAIQLAVVTSALISVIKTVQQLQATARNHAGNIDRYVSEIRALQRQVQQIAAD